MVYCDVIIERQLGSTRVVVPISILSPLLQSWSYNSHHSFDFFAPFLFSTHPVKKSSFEDTIPRDLRDSPSLSRLDETKVEGVTKVSLCIPTGVSGNDGRTSKESVRDHCVDVHIGTF